MWTRYDLKMNAKTAFTRNYWTCVAVSLVVGVLSGGMFAGSGSGVQTTMEVQHNNPYAYDSYSAYSYDSGSLLGIGIFSSILMGILLIFMLAAVLYTIFVGNVVSVGGCRYFMENREHQTKVSQVYYNKHLFTSSFYCFSYFTRTICVCHAKAMNNFSDFFIHYKK